MSDKTPFSTMNLTVACGPVPCDTEEGREFLQDRLALFGKVGFLLVAAHYVVSNALEVLSNEAPAGATWQRVWIGDLSSRLHLLGCGVFAALYFFCRAGRRGHAWLALTDIFSLAVVGTLFGIRCSEHAHESSADQAALLGLTNVVLARAVIVPSSALRTLVSSVLASLPLCIGSYLTSGSAVAAGLAGWTALPVAVATVASRIIYGLREEVREARQFGQYTLEERIGEGGMGDVYRARHAMLRRPTALKLLRPDRAGERSLARFEREVQLTSELTHPNTVAIYDYGRTPEGDLYYAMEYLDGLNLESLVKEHGPQPPSRVIHILGQVCASLAEAHDIGLIHRDIKPANVILCERGGRNDVVKVVDFGLVKDIEGRRSEVTVSAVNTVTGTPMYMSPEAIRSPEAIGPQSDLYAIGAVGYYLLSGHPVFEGDNFMEICSHHLQTIPEPPSTRARRTLPSDIEGLILMCLEKSPSKRPRDARALRQALEKCEAAGEWTEERADEWWRLHGKTPTTGAGAAPTADHVAPMATRTESAVSSGLASGSASASGRTDGGR